MTRTVSDAFRTALYAQETGEALAALVTFNLVVAENVADVVRRTNHPTSLTSNANVFTPHDMGLQLPSSQPGSSTRARMSLDYVDRTLVTRLRAMISGTIDLALVLASDPDRLEVEWSGIEIGAIRWDIRRATVDLVGRDDKREPFPVPASTPTVTPGAF